MEEPAKLLVLLVAIALFIQLLKHGPQGPKLWLRAKFLGEGQEPPQTPAPRRRRVAE
jgi:hypothetical protein